MRGNPYEATEFPQLVRWSPAPDLSDVAVLVRFSWWRWVLRWWCALPVLACVDVFLILQTLNSVMADWERMLAWGGVGIVTAVTVVVLASLIGLEKRSRAALAESDTHIYIWAASCGFRGRCLRLAKQDILGVTTCWLAGGESADYQAVVLRLNPEIITPMSAATYWRFSFVPSESVAFDPDEERNACILDCSTWECGIETASLLLSACQERPDSRGACP